MAVSLSEFAIASDLFSFNKFEELQDDVLNKLLELLLTPVSDIGEKSVSSLCGIRTHDPPYTGPLLYQLSLPGNWSLALSQQYFTTLSISSKKIPV